MNTPEERARAAAERDRLKTEAGIDRDATGALVRDEEVTAVPPELEPTPAPRERVADRPQRARAGSRAQRAMLDEMEADMARRREEAKPGMPPPVVPGAPSPLPAAALPSEPSGLTTVHRSADDEGERTTVTETKGGASPGLPGFRRSRDSAGGGPRPAAELADEPL